MKRPALCVLLLLVATLTNALADSEKEQLLDKYVARSADGRLRLEVEIYRPKKDEYEARKNSNGNEVYFYQGKKIDEDYARASGYAGFITKFEFSWDGQRIEIPRRFWEDLMVPLSAVVKDVDKLGGEELYEFVAEQNREYAERPKLSVSASDTEGTALIEWRRSLLHCDKSAVERWIISKKGAVMRHTFIAPSLGC
ncbi:MAG: hypothetical protein ACKOQ6_09055 [Bacteroidota bacterium]